MKRHGSVDEVARAALFLAFDALSPRGSSCLSMEVSRQIGAPLCRTPKEERRFVSLKNAQSEVSVIGLGAMGSALARALLHNGDRVTVWNRTSAKAEPLGLSKRAMAAGYAEEEFAALIKVLRRAA
jgi:phosphoglycerate dehydrogenase-like enzyme